MQKILIVFSILFSAIGLKSIASEIENYSNPIISDLQNAGLSNMEIEDLEKLLHLDPIQFQKAIDQDYRIKGKLKIEIMALSNGSGSGPCIQKNQN